MLVEFTRPGLVRRSEAPRLLLGGPQALQIAAQGSTRLLNKAQWLGVTSPCWPVNIQGSLLQSSLRSDGMRYFLLTGSDFAIPIQSLMYLWHVARSAKSKQYLGKADRSLIVCHESLERHGSVSSSSFMGLARFSKTQITASVADEEKPGYM